MLERVSANQLLALVVVSRVSLTLVYHGALPDIRQDVWWETLFDALMLMFTAWTLNHLWRRFPGQTLFQVMETILGRFLGKTLGLLYVLLLLLSFSHTLRLTGDVLIITSLPQTPLVVVAALLALLAALCVRAGIETLARSAQIIMPLLTGSVIMIFVLLLNHIHFGELLPFQILVTGPVPHIKAIIGAASRTVEFISVGVLFPFCSPRKDVVPALCKSAAWLGFVWVLMFIQVFGILGQDIEAFPYPWVVAIRAVEIVDFVERIDILVIALWILGIFVRNSLLLWTATLGLAQVLGLQRYRTLALPLAIIGTAYAIAQADSVVELLHMTRVEILVPFSGTFVILIPLGLLALASLFRLGRPVSGGFSGP